MAAMRTHQEKYRSRCFVRRLGTASAVAEIVNHASGVPHVVERAGVEAVGSDSNGKCDGFWCNRRKGQIGRKANRTS